MTVEIPSFVLINPEGEDACEAIYAGAFGYAQAALVLSKYADVNESFEVLFPAVVCSGFAAELFLKLLLLTELPEAPTGSTEMPHGHKLKKDLWDKLSEDNKALVAGMHNNTTGKPILSGSSQRISHFETILAEIGTAPFVDWRYVHELTNAHLISHAAIREVVDALGYASTYRLNQRKSAKTNLPI